MLKGALIGVGKIAQECHLPAFRDKLISERGTITAAADISKTSLEHCKNLYPEISYYSSPEELFHNEMIDFVDICIPPAYHSQALKQAISHNLNIICEKPFTSSLKEAIDIYQMLLRSPLFFIPCHQYRYSPLWQLFKKMALEINDSDSAYLQFNVFRTEADRGLSVSNNLWRIKPEISGGGILSDTGVHYIYLCLWMLGYPKTVTVRTFNLQHGNYNVEDTATVILEYKNSVAEINLTWAADRRANSARFVTSKGSLYYDGNKLLRYKNSMSEEMTVPDASDKSTYVAMFTNLFDEFFCQVEQKKRDNSVLVEALQTVKLLDLCYRSAEGKKTLVFDAE